MFARLLLTLGVLVTLALPGTLRAQPPLLTLQQAISQALNNNYDVLLAGEQQRLAKNDYTVGNAGFLPRLTLSATPNLSVTTTQQQFANGNELNVNNAVGQQFNGGLNLGWTLFDGTAMFVNYRRLGTLLQRAKLVSKQQLEQTTADVVRTYSDAVRLQRVLADLLRSREVSALRLRLAESRYRLGAADKIELTQAQIDFLADSANVVRQTQSLQLAKIALNRLMARAPETDFSLQDSLPLVESLNFENLRRNALLANEQLLITQNDRSLSELQVRLARAAYWPTLNLNTGFNVGYVNNPAGFVRRSLNQVFGLGATLQFNLFDGLNQRRIVRNALMNVNIARTLLDRQRLELESTLLSTWLQFEAARQVQRIETRNYQLAGENLQLAGEAYRLGTLSGLELKVIQADYLSASSRVTNATHEVKQLETALLQLSSGLVSELETANRPR